MQLHPMEIEKVVMEVVKDESVIAAEKQLVDDMDAAGLTGMLPMSFGSSKSKLSTMKCIGISYTAKLIILI